MNHELDNLIKGANKGQHRNYLQMKCLPVFPLQEQNADTLQRGRSCSAKVDLAQLA